MCGSIYVCGLLDFGLWGLDDLVGGEVCFIVCFEGLCGCVEVCYVGCMVMGGCWVVECLDLRFLLF